MRKLLWKWFIKIRRFWYVDICHKHVEFVDILDWLDNWDQPWNKESNDH